MKLLLAILMLFFSFTANCQTAPIQFDSTDINLDSICAKDHNYELTWKFVNTSKSPVIIKQVQTSGSILLCSWDKTPILPGKSTIIKGSLYTRGKENQSFIKYADLVLANGYRVKLSVKGYRDCLSAVPTQTH